MEPDIIMEILSKLALADRLNLGLCCKELEQFHNSETKFWQKVWIQLRAGRMESFTHDSSRNYHNVEFIFGCGDDEPTLLEVLGPCVSSLTALKIEYRRRSIEELYYKNAYNGNHSKLIENIRSLSLFDNLVSLELQTDFEKKCYPPTIDATTAPVKMEKIQHILRLDSKCLSPCKVFSISRRALNCNQLIFSTIAIVLHFRHF